MELYVWRNGAWAPCPEEIIAGDVVLTRANAMRNEADRARMGAVLPIYLPSIPPTGQVRTGWRRADTAVAPTYAPVYGPPPVTVETLRAEIDAIKAQVAANGAEIAGLKNRPV